MPTMCGMMMNAVVFHARLHPLSYVYSGKYSNLDAWDQFTRYIAFYDEVVDYDTERAPAPELYDVYYAYDPDTEEEAGQCVDEVIQIAEESGAEIQFY